MQTNCQNFSSRMDAHENALKRSLFVNYRQLFVNYSSTVLMGVTHVGCRACSDRLILTALCSRLFLMMICNQQLVGSNPTAGSNRVSMQESSIASLRRPREGSITARMKWILILFVASASLCFAQGNTAAAPRVSPTPQPHPSPAPRPTPSRFVEPNFFVPTTPDVNDYRPVVNAEGTTVIFERNATATPNDIKLHSIDLASGDVQPFVNFASTRPIGAGTGPEVGLRAVLLHSAIMTAFIPLIRAANRSCSRTREV